MKTLRILAGAALSALLLAGCSSAYYASSGAASDDLYAPHDRAEIARRQQAAAEAKRAEAAARQAEWEARLAEAEAAAAEKRYYSYESAEVNPYRSVVADDYESAYARRLRGMESPTYRMPSSYYDLRYSSAFTYATAYDPAFYNIIVSGDQVWVEPKYITSMFGTWGGTPYGWYVGWNYRPASMWWGYPSWAWGGMNWGFGWSWYDPWWGPSWTHGWHDHWHGHWHPGWHPWQGPSFVGHRPVDYRNGRRPSRYVPGGGSSSGNRYQGGRYEGSRYQGAFGSGSSRGEGNRGGRVYYESGGRRNGSSSVFGSGRNDNRGNSFDNNRNNGNRNNSFDNNRYNNSNRNGGFDSPSRSNNSGS